MLFSIIVPVYNVEKYLDECIESIEKQLFLDFEVILVDDGSIDHSPELCDKWGERDNRIQVIHKNNGGQSDARNVGTKAAKGDYIVYIDSDDYICDERFLSKLAEKVYAGFPDVIVYKFQKYYDEQQKMQKCGYSFLEFDSHQVLADRIASLVITDSFYCSAWSKAIKKEILIKNNIQFEKGLLGEDQDWYYHVLSVIDSLDGINEAFIVYRQRANSITSSWKIKNLTDCISIVNKWAITLAQSDNFQTKYKEVLLNSVAKLYCNLLIGYSRFTDKQKKQYYYELIKLSYLLNYDLNPRVHKMKVIKKIVGFRGLMLILSFLCKFR